MTVVAADTLGRFPRVEGSNLEGERFALPADFKGELNVVLVAFKREHQGDVDSWTPFLKSVAETRRDLRTYELPVLARGYRLMRPFIDGGMRRGIPDAAVRAATITLYIDKTPFREALRLPDEDRILSFSSTGGAACSGGRTAGSTSVRAPNWYAGSMPASTQAVAQSASTKDGARFTATSSGAVDGAVPSVTGCGLGPIR